jgi:hypothetical protein
VAGSSSHVLGSCLTKHSGQFTRPHLAEIGMNLFFLLPGPRVGAVEGVMVVVLVALVVLVVLLFIEKIGASACGHGAEHLGEVVQ